MYIAKKNVAFVLVIFLFVICILMSFTLMSWIHPVKYAIQEEDFSDYSEYILVREVYYTGTGWSMIGDTGGYFPSEEVRIMMLRSDIICTE